MWIFNITYNFDNDDIIQSFNTRDEAIEALNAYLRQEIKVIKTKSEYEPSVLILDDNTIVLVYASDYTDTDNILSKDCAYYRIFYLEDEKTLSSKINFIKEYNDYGTTTFYYEGDSSALKELVGDKYHEANGVYINIKCPSNCLEANKATVEISPYKTSNSSIRSYGWFDVHLSYDIIEELINMAIIRRKDIIHYHKKYKDRAQSAERPLHRCQMHQRTPRCNK